MDEHGAEVVRRLLRAAHRLRGALDGEFARFGLTGIRFEVLGIVRDAGPSGCPQAELARRLDQSESSVSTLVERMTSDGLLNRLSTPADRRRRFLVLTDKGRRLLDEAGAQHTARAARLFRRFDGPQVAALSDLLHRLDRELEGQGSRVESQGPAATT